jgi:hypothetical protein
MKPELKAPGTMLFKLGYEEPVSNFAFKFNLRRYIMVVIIMCLMNLGVLTRNAATQFALTVGT